LQEIQRVPLSPRFSSFPINKERPPGTLVFRQGQPQVLSSAAQVPDQQAASSSRPSASALRPQNAVLRNDDPAIPQTFLCEDEINYLKSIKPHLEKVMPTCLQYNVSLFFSDSREK
jgi:DNA segregation ATPase FtsK/SpoIIIE-like protein